MKSHVDDMKAATDHITAEKVTLTNALTTIKFVRIDSIVPNQA